MTNLQEPWKIEVTGPLGASLTAYDRSQHPRSQDTSKLDGSTISPTFLNAMTVREEVFVVEQGVPLDNELDDDDTNCVHFVLYPDAGTSKPAGTIRIVPQSSDLHTDFDKHRHIDGTPYLGEVTSSTYNGEPFLKLGRLAVVKPQRGHGYADALVKAALRYAAANPRDLITKTSSSQHSLGPKSRDWQGLVLIHAQKQVQGFWARLGFTLDEGLGIWDEEGMDHVAMWTRVSRVDGTTP
ncbi:hypothetical protein AMS68_002042 [Peltaster fructicola]|uniref:N-acetyltransferase domain-containing protein n=1 Tax=Peltaster fructicola TaxID=286661 RepID=A0A6H0XPG5_9PEZI|nr:hypothetical protein AMS68_002042 [Peltaster fructicola]